MAKSSGPTRANSEKKRSDTAYSMADVARHFQRSYYTVRAWVRSGLFTLPAKYSDIKPHVDALDARNLNKPVDDEAVIAARKSKVISEAEFWGARASIETRKDELAAADVVHRHDMHQFFAMFFSQVRDQLQRLAEQMKPGLPSKHRTQISEDLKERHDLVLKNLAAWRPRIDEIAELNGESDRRT